MPLLTILMWFAVLSVALFILLKSADYFVDTAELFGRKLNVPSFIVGATVVAFGTSLPELAVAISSILKGHPEIVTGTVVGSNISNIFLIGGIAILMSSAFMVTFTKQVIAFVFVIGSALLLSIFLWDLNISLVEGIICTALLVAYVVYILVYPHEDDEEEDDGDTTVDWKRVTLFMLSGLGIWLGAEFTIMAIKKVSLGLGMGSNIISQTIVALGTSLPELAVTLAAVKRARFNLVLGNIMGSNIFNSLCVIGIPSLVGWGVLGDGAFQLPSAANNEFAIPLMLLATALLLILGLMKKTPRFFGVLFILLYMFYIAGSFGSVNLLSLIP